MAITLAQAQAHLDAWLAADLRLASGQSYTVEGRSVSRSETERKVIYWEKKVDKLSRGGISVRHAQPTDPK